MRKIYITIGVENTNTLLFSFELFMTKLSTNFGTNSTFLLEQRRNEAVRPSITVEREL